jgi:hypothetical protein
MYMFKLKVPLKTGRQATLRSNKLKSLLKFYTSQVKALSCCSMSSFALEATCAAV